MSAPLTSAEARDIRRRILDEYSKALEHGVSAYGAVEAVAKGLRLGGGLNEYRVAHSVVVDLLVRYGAIEVCANHLDAHRLATLARDMDRLPDDPAGPAEDPRAQAAAEALQKDAPPPALNREDAAGTMFDAPGQPSAAPGTADVEGDLDRPAVILAIRKNLRARSGKSWSVTGGSGTDWGWIHVSAPPARQVDGYMTDADQEELRGLLGLESLSKQGESIAASSDYYREYLERSRGLPPTKVARPYWD